MIERFNPTQPIQLDGTATTMQSSTDVTRDPHMAFTTQVNQRLVPPEFVVRPDTPPVRGEQPVLQKKRGNVPRRGFLGLLAAGAVVLGAAAYTAPKIIEKVDEAIEQIDGAEARTRATEMAKSFVAAGHAYFSDQLATTAYPYIEAEQAEPYVLSKDAMNGKNKLFGSFGFNSYYDADSGLELSVTSPESPYDGVARTGLEVFFKDKTAVVSNRIAEGQATFGDLMAWTERATAPKDPTVPLDPEDPNNTLEMTRIAILAVNENKYPPEAEWYAVEIHDDAVLVLKRGSKSQGYDDNGILSEDWLSPNDPNYSTAFKQTMAALEKGLADFTENAKTAR